MAGNFSRPTPVPPESAPDRETPVTPEGREGRIQTLNSVTRALNGILDLNDLQSKFLELLRGSIPFDYASVSLMENERHFRHLATDEMVAAPGIIGRAGSATDWVVEQR
ncbi:MAG: hypothetical protein EXS64_04825 [Candidatus Latescibacteria bacterium]|nr:hypothetical protein [Candidatus Latescibacterota bacterium]